MSASLLSRERVNSQPERKSSLSKLRSTTDEDIILASFLVSKTRYRDGPTAK